MNQFQINREKKVAHRGNIYGKPSSNGFVKKGHMSTTGFITPNSLGAKIIDGDRVRFLNTYDRAILGSRIPLQSQPPSQQEANKVLLPLGILQDAQSQFPYIARVPTNFVYKKEVEDIQKIREDDFIEKTEDILDRIDMIQIPKGKQVEFA